MDGHCIFSRLPFWGVRAGNEYLLFQEVGVKQHVHKPLCDTFPTTVSASQDASHPVLEWSEEHGFLL